MKYVRLSLDHDSEARHPMHQFVVDHEGFEASRLVAASPVVDGLRSALFHVRGGPIEDYEAALDGVASVTEYAVSPCPDDSFYLYTRDELSPEGQRLADAFATVGLVLLYPVAYRADGTIRVSVVGPGETVQAALADLPAGVAPDVLEVGEYGHRRLADGERLTDRQFEAVRAAVDCGYYGDPRDGSVADVAEELGCAPGTAAEHLRRAERRVMAALVDGSQSLSGPIP
ncbi:helix-turn-helix domain-containing protein [Halomicrobium urmianum]|uniref:helix-turn-helix domain-containing protein n=1 Tax=Halomicrobium urmianum TaxID=1586233 RepID=UPI001CD998D7|nr:helix-turn-helix domain-containing protein [Halomicrobium urmianum]